MSIPRPEPGLVINYSYLWQDDVRKGRSEGGKNRPCVIVLSKKIMPDGGLVVTVAPITHTPPRGLGEAIEIPQAVKAHLGLDAERSWIMLAEANRFSWPGFDLRKIANTGKFAFGFLPPRLFERVQREFLQGRKAGREKLALRD